MSRGKRRQEYQSNRYRVRIVYVSRFTSAGKLFISDRSPSVFVDVVASNHRQLEHVFEMGVVHARARNEN